MATLREYFDTDPRAHCIHTNWTFESQSGVKSQLIAKLAYELEANAKFWYFYVPPATPNLSDVLQTLFSSEQFKNCILNEAGIQISQGIPGYSETLSTTTTIFTHRAHIYLDEEITSADKANLVNHFFAQGYSLSIRDRGYASKRSEIERPLAFISHDSSDKEIFVRQLALELIKNGCPVWYDEFSLKVGDSLRENIERGLREARKCIVVLSQNFFCNNGWARAEYDSIFTREMLEKSNVILPVWLNVDAKAVYKYSPRLADKVGLPSILGVEEIARILATSIKTAQ